MAKRDPFEKVIGQERVCSFLRTAIETDGVSNAYLFLGKPGSGKLDTARAFAAALLCPKGGCGACETCVSVDRKSHPDVHYLTPGGQGGYVVAQIREVIAKVNMTPVRGARKVFIIDRADLFNPSSANAFLKTLEEPPADTVFILLGRSRESMLETIMSRCTVLPFRTIGLEEAVEILHTRTGSPRQDCAIAIASSGASLSRAHDFLVSPKRRQDRNRIIEVLDRLPDADDLDVLNYARELVAIPSGQLDPDREANGRRLAESEEWLSKGNLKELEKQLKRELSFKERRAFKEMQAVIESWLRDLLLLLSGHDDLVVNADDLASLSRIAKSISPADITAAIHATRETMAPISYNVSPELCIGNALFSIREALVCTK